MWTRSQLKQQAKQSMRLNYKKMLLVSFIVLILSGDFFRIIYNFFDWMRISDSSVLYEYFMIPYILAEQPDISSKEAFEIGLPQSHWL